MSKESIECIYCASKRYREQYSFEDIYEDRYTLLHCLECEAHYLNPKPSEEQLKRAYDEAYYGTGEKKFNPTVEKVIDWFRRQKAGGLSKYISGNARVLDIGCGNGNFLHNLGKYGHYELHGIEPEGKSAERAENYEEIKLLKGFLEEGAYPENYFDAISLIHVFEHLPNPKETLDIIDQISKKETILYIEVPNIDSWQASFFKGNWLHLDPPRHLILLSPKRMKQIMKERGWEPMAEKYFSPQFSPFGVQQSLLNRICSKRDVLYEHLKGNKQYTSTYSWLELKLQHLFHLLSFPLFVFSDLIASVFGKGGTVRLVFRKMS